MAATGAILSSLYVISPPEGIDLGGAGPEVRSGDVAAVAIDESVTVIERELARLEDAVNASAGLDDGGEASAKERSERVERERGELIDRDWGGAGATGQGPSSGLARPVAGRAGTTGGEASAKDLSEPPSGAGGPAGAGT